MQKIRNIVFYIFLLMLALQSYELSAKNRFPKPEFESGHTQPNTITPPPRTLILEYLDVIVLLASISLISWLILKKRSRKAVFLTGIFSILYFGFYREGCICSIGAIQNVVLALFYTNYKIPLTALLFFIIPILYTLFFGRTFCAGICPLGALQDIVAVKPMPVKIWLEKVLGIIPFIYLAFAVLYAATASDFIICRYDPFVGFYRFDASFMMFAIGGLLLIIGVFIARPYCRYLCPYGALLNIVSRFSFHHMKITPAECINCKLCENSCPYSAINIPATRREKEKTDVMVRRYIMLSLILPVLVVAGGFITSNFHEKLAMVNHKVKLASEILHNTNYGIKGKEAIEITAFKSSGQTVAQLNTEAAAIISTFRTASWYTGAFIGLVIGLTLIGLSVFKYHVDYTPNKASCLSCARCMDYCPVLPEKKL